MTTPRIDPFRTFNFRLEIDNLTASRAFSDVSGLTSDGRRRRLPHRRRTSS